MITYNGTIALTRGTTPEGLQKLSEIAAYIDKNYFSTTLSSRDGVVYLDYSIETSLIDDLNLKSDDVRCWVWSTVARVLIEALSGELNAHDQGAAGNMD